MNNLLDTIDTKSKEFQNTVSIVTTAAAAGIAVAKAIEKNQRIGAVVGIGLGLVAYAMFSPKSRLKKEKLKLEKQIQKLESEIEK
jgi:uncharacterized membrane protein YgaE (UPF0421/DUF939 family)